MKDTKDVIVAVNEIVLFLVERLADGVSADDFFSVWNKLVLDDDFKMIMKDAIEGYQNIPDEVSSPSIQDMLDITTTQIQYVFKMIAAAKKKT